MIYLVRDAYGWPRYATEDEDRAETYRDREVRRAKAEGLMSVPAVEAIEQ